MRRTIPKTIAEATENLRGLCGEPRIGKHQGRSGHRHSIAIARRESLMAEEDMNSPQRHEDTKEVTWGF
jgi:hypothetical protein